jgi:hypothetical protein
MKKLFYSSVLLLCILFAFSCKKTAPVSVIPVISFAGFTATDNSTAVLTFNFTDGDGDIGVPSGDSTIDCYIRYYYLSPTSGKYLPLYAAISGNPNPNSLADSNIYTYSIPYITDNLKSKSLDGQVVINMNGYKSTHGALPDSLDSFRYTIWIFDRAGHKSNVVTTPGLYAKF